MGLVHRGNRVYLYRSERRAGRVRVEYLASGTVAETLARSIDRQRARSHEARRAAAAHWEALRAELDALDAQIGEYFRLADGAFREAMEEAGWHLHKRQWRKSRTMKPTPKIDRLSTMPLGHDIVFLVKQILVDRFAGTKLDSLDKQIDAHAMMEAWHEEVAGPFPTPVEEILVERVVVCRFNAYLADLEVEREVGVLTPAQLASLERRRDGCHRRLLSAVKALEMVRRKALTVNQGTMEDSNGKRIQLTPANRLSALVERN